MTENMFLREEEIDDRPICYQIGDGRMWDVTTAAYVDAQPEGTRLIELWDNGRKGDEQTLIKTLYFYHFDLGSLTDKCPEAIKDKLAELDAKYLTQRVLAGLATGDEYAQSQWQAHEAEAAPLREKLAELAAAK